MEDGRAPSLVPRLCHVVRWPDFNGYGFNLHAEKGKAGQFIGKVDAGSPAEAAGLREGDRIVEVNGINIGNENHQQVVSRIKSGGDETRLLVVDNATDMHYKGSMTVVRGDLAEVRFITAARDQQINANGSAHTTTTTTTTPASSSSPPAAGVPAVSPHYPVRLCRLRKWADFDGYGFNLHAEKDKPGQFIGVVDPMSPAETGGLREGDRIVEVGGENIEALTHAGVIGRVKAGGDRAELLVVDSEADAYYKGLGVGVSSGMVGVTVISTPPTSSSSSSSAGQAATESEMVTEAVAQEVVESTPEPPRDEEPVPNGLQVEDKEEEQEQEAPKEEEEVVVSTILQVTQAAPVVEEVVNVEEKEKEKEEEKNEEEEEVAEGVGAMNDYEPVEVVAAVPTFSSPPPAPAADEDLGVARYGGYGINGGSEVSEPEPTRPAEPEPAPTPVEPEPIPTARVPEPEPEPEPAVIRSTVTAAAPRGPLMGGGLELNVSAAEMKERLRARKKQDPRFHKTSFEAKSKMFEKL